MSVFLAGFRQYRQKRRSSPHASALVCVHTSYHGQLFFWSQIPLLVLSIRTPMKAEAGGSLEPCRLRLVRSTWWGHFSKRKENGRRKGRKVSVGRMPSNSSPGWPGSWGWPWISDPSAFNSRAPRSQGGIATPSSCVAGCMLVKHYQPSYFWPDVLKQYFHHCVYWGVVHMPWSMGGISSLLLPSGFQGSNSGHGSLGQAPLPLSHPSQAAACFS